MERHRPVNKQREKIIRFTVILGWEGNSQGKRGRWEVGALHCQLSDALDEGSLWTPTTT